MKKTLAIIAMAGAAGLMALGLLFLCAATQEPARIPIATLLLLAGSGLAIWGERTLRRLRDIEPESLDDRITRLAGKGNGEVTLSQVVAELNASDEAAIAALNTLERRGQCRREHVGDDAREVYVFPGLKPNLVERRCPYCGAEFSVKKAVYKCPNCGGDLRLERE
jgi:hypothetical protein